MLRLKGSDVSSALRSVRRLRRASLDPVNAAPCLHPALSIGLGHVCAGLASWIEATVTDRRAVDATIRFFGLDRLPEDLGEIGGSLRVRGRRDPVGGPVGVSARQVEKLITYAIDELRRSAPEDVAAAPAGPLPPPADPFPPPVAPSARPALESLLWRAWAQIPDGERVATIALLHYEAEHGLRATGPTPASRTERARWRRLAWSVLDVAGYRAARTDRDYPEVDRLMGPRFLAMAEVAHAGDAITALLAPGAFVDAIEAAIPTLRAAVRAGLDEAPELLGIVRDALLRATYRREREAPPAIESKLLTLSTILARERRDVGGIALGRTALERIDQLLEHPVVGRDAAVRAAIVSDGLRTSQELAGLYDGLGLPREAHRQLAAMQAFLRRFGDPEREAEPGGWLQQLYLTAAGVNRHLARAEGRSIEWLRAGATAAQRSIELAGNLALPRSWAIAAQTQALAALLDRAGTEPLLTEAHRLLRDLEQQSRAAGLDEDRAGRSTLFGVRLIGWRLALLQGNVAAIGQAQAATLRLGGALGGDLDTIARYQRAGAQLGVAPDEGALQRLRRQVPDRLRPRDRRAQWIRRH